MCREESGYFPDEVETRAAFAAFLFALLVFLTTFCFASGGHQLPKQGFALFFKTLFKFFPLLLRGFLSIAQQI